MLLGNNSPWVSEFLFVLQAEAQIPLFQTLFQGFLYAEQLSMIELVYPSGARECLSLGQNAGELMAKHQAHDVSIMCLHAYMNVSVTARYQSFKLHVLGFLFCNGTHCLCKPYKVPFSSWKWAWRTT